MANLSSDEMQSLLQKYQGQLEQHLNVSYKRSSEPISSREYLEFKRELMPAPMTWYEKACNLSERVFKVTSKPEKQKQLQDAISTSHLSITPAGASSFAFMGPIVFILATTVLSLTLSSQLFFIAVSLIAGLLLIPLINSIPFMIANTWRMKASNQMVLAVFYIVTYMRHTSNLENAINFAAEHLGPPLSLDLKKIIWDVETQKYDTIQESLDAYLESWRDHNLEFIESFHLIQSSLYEPADARRISMLDKALDVILDETYEKMLHYAHNLQSPVTMLHMLGIVMPILGLVVLPLVVSFMENVRWYHLALLYDVLLPLGIFYMAKNILSTRPTGYGDSDISEDHPEFKKYRGVVLHLFGQELVINPLWISLTVGAVLLLIGLSPLLIHLLAPGWDMGLGSTIDTSSVCGKSFCLLEYKPSKLDSEVIIGPFGLGASVLGLFIPLAFGLSIGLYFKLKSQNIIKIRERSKQLEQEFASALFQLGNRIGDGIPAELAFDRVADTMQGTISGSFFEVVSTNIKRLGMSVKDAIFNLKTGALIYYPSKIIESSMKVLIVSVKKGPTIAAQALVNVSRYLKEMHRVDERLKDLMADIISSMKSQIKFLAPAVAGIVIGITSMIATILGKLGRLFPQIQGSTGTTGTSTSNIANLFGDGVPTYFFQLVVGIYIVQIIYIMTTVTNGIENGSDKLSERYNLGKNLINSTLSYTIIALCIMLVFNMIAGQVLGKGIGGA